MIPNDKIKAKIKQLMSDWHETMERFGDDGYIPCFIEGLEELYSIAEENTAKYPLDHPLGQDNEGNVVAHVETDEDLDREIFFYKVPFQDDKENLDERTLDLIARHFVEWQKKRDEDDMALKYFYGLDEGGKIVYEEMLKNAVEGTITNAGGEFGYDVAAFRFDENHTYTVLLPHEEGNKYGDKVKLIIDKGDRL